MLDLPALAARWRAAPQTAVRLAVFGSSNTELFWHNQGRFSWACWLATSLREHVGRQVTTINVGVSGDTVVSLLNRAGRDLWPLSPTAAIVTIGGNDQWQMDVATYRTHLRTLMLQIREHGVLPILRTYYSLILDEKPNERFSAYMDAVRDVASELDIPCIDCYALFHPWHQREPAEYRKIMLDGGHLNALGHAIGGVLTVRAFGLPDPPMPEDFAAPVARILRAMTREPAAEKRLAALV